MSGRSPRNGIVFFVFDESFRMRPARKFVSPSFRRIDDVIVRVPMIGCFVPSLAVDVAGDLRDLDRELERDLLVVVDARLDVDLDADVLVLERRDRDDARRADRLLRVDRRDGDRHAVADDELRLLALGDAELRLGEELGVRVVLDEVERDRSGS